MFGDNSQSKGKEKKIGWIIVYPLKNNIEFWLDIRERKREKRSKPYILIKYFFLLKKEFSYWILNDERERFNIKV